MKKTWSQTFGMQKLTKQNNTKRFFHKISTLNKYKGAHQSTQFFCQKEREKGKNKKLMRQLHSLKLRN